MASRKMNHKIKTFKQLKSSYEYIWSKTDLVEEKYYYEWVTSLLGDPKGKKLLDVGCGGGYLLKEADKAGMETYGIDISKKAIEKAKLRSTNSKLIVGVAEKLPYKNNGFDVVVCLGSLEHFLNPKKSLQEMKRVLKKDGLVCIVLPNKWAIDAIFEGAFRGVELSHGQELERFYSYHEAHQLLTSSNLHIVKALPYNRPFPTHISTGTKKSSIINWLYSKTYLNLIRWIIPTRLSYLFVFILKK